MRSRIRRAAIYLRVSTTGQMVKNQRDEASERKSRLLREVRARVRAYCGPYLLRPGQLLSQYAALVRLLGLPVARAEAGGGFGATALSQRACTGSAWRLRRSW